jgi:hypothetical protein
MMFEYTAVMWVDQLTKLISIAILTFSAPVLLCHSSLDGVMVA